MSTTPPPASALADRVAVGPALVVGVLAVSTAAILIRIAEAPSLALAFWRCAVGGVVLAPAALRSRRRAPALDAGQWRQLAGSGVLLAGHFAAFVSSLSFTTVASAALLVALAPVFVGIGGAVFLREPPTRRTWAGMALAAAGAVVVAAGDLDARAGDTALLGNVLALVAAVLVAGYLLVGRAARRRLPVSLYAGVVYGIAAAALLVACLVTRAPLAGYDTSTWWAIAGLVAGPQLLGHTVFNALLSRVSATVVAVVSLTEPVGASLLALLLLGEAPTARLWVGAPLLLTGVWLAATSRRAAVPAPL
jgi:drug/metabolite transporter (DMT)-like permease